MTAGLVRTTPQRTAAALWLPATGPGTPPDGYARQLAQATGPFLDRFAALDEDLARHHPAGVFHHHLAILAVRPDSQGQGIGTALLQAHDATFDWQGIASYLEASDERTRGLYLRYGYRPRPRHADPAARRPAHVPHDAAPRRPHPWAGCRRPA